MCYFWTEKSKKSVDELQNPVVLGGHVCRMTVFFSLHPPKTLKLHGVNTAKPTFTNEYSYLSVAGEMK